MRHEDLIVTESPGQHMTEDEFFRFCRDNSDLRIERDKSGNVLIMPPHRF